jgi:hypothetical protein
MLPMCTKLNVEIFAPSRPWHLSEIAEEIVTKSKHERPVEITLFLFLWCWPPLPMLIPLPNRTKHLIEAEEDIAAKLSTEMRPPMFTKLLTDIVLPKWQ